ncbi:hypothetical protein E0Z10_g3920 [Xylaria hypoxylon]|uniref:Uncharacterized protein n=1 Tax=Xylaria hypoxylon TaxID=37992 RepID=A0A4Z0YY08_9PEZI|nr:hypothetical protein E0Z10_g3920 [Xylaria hypoxylon]
MESIKQFLTSKNNKSKPGFRKHLQISSPVEGSFKKLTSESSPATVYPPQLPSHCQYTGDSHVGSAAIDFIPQARGRDETIAWLNTSTYDSLASLLTEQDQAAKQIRRGPRTKATREVQMILNSPSCKTVEDFHHVRQHSEMAVRYGAPGVIAYNFSKSLGWNLASTSRLPSLQLRDFETTMRKIRIGSSCIPAMPFSPIDWLVLPQLTGTRQSGTQWQLSNQGHDYELQEQQAQFTTQITSNPWRDSEQVDIADSRLLPYERPSGERGALDVSEDEGEGEYDPFDIDDMRMTASETEAIAVKMTPVRSRQVRQVRI